jgi:hypothetical protein
MSGDKERTVFDANSGVPDTLLASVHTKKEEVGLNEVGERQGVSFRGIAKEFLSS